ncbi:AI-2E family transporter [Oceanirhabdus sp. W0125-5]|uniref:AI-2E family transporter n=1 Tax=Oceanirhabdus sp. W0125-5 TaxID=2999116 RepID=UPI0022F2D662|nr:AI-2E family transporter [Oceanirhabdus sp. W0125-5]WBW99606.1 AI-2E family transporter [Oceanirhabdus sp. W0125-5]
MKLNKDNLRRIIAIFIIGIVIALSVSVPPIRGIVELIFFSFILSYALKPIHNILVERGINRAFSAVVIIFSFLMIFISAILLVIPSIIKEGSNILKLLEGIGEFINNFSFKIEILEDLKLMDNVMEKGSEFLESTANKMIENSMKWVVSFKENIVKSVGIPIIAFFFLSEGDKLGNKILVLFSYKRRRIIANILRDIDRVLTKYILSELILCIIIALSTYVILKVYNVEFPLLLSLINGILNIIPYFGAPIGAMIVILVAIVNGNGAWLYIIIWIVISQGVESNIISPMIIGESVNMHPVMIIVLLIFGGEIGGFIGMVLAIPVGVIIKVLYIDINHFLFCK